MRYPKYSDPREAFWAVTLSKTRNACHSRRGLAFNLTLEDVMSLEILQEGCCALTGIKYQHWRGGYGGGKNSLVATLDRIDSKQGYVVGNVQIACWFANCLKGDLPMYHWQSHYDEVLKQILEQHGSYST